MVDEKRVIIVGDDGLAPKVQRLAEFLSCQGDLRLKLSASSVVVAAIMPVPGLRVVLRSDDVAGEKMCAPVEPGGGRARPGVEVFRRMCSLCVGQEPACARQVSAQLGRDEHRLVYVDRVVEEAVGKLDQGAVLIQQLQRQFRLTAHGCDGGAASVRASQVVLLRLAVLRQERVVEALRASPVAALHVKPRQNSR